MLRETRLIFLKIAADLSARARAAMRYLPPRRTDAPKVALPARTAVGLIEVLETAMGRGEEPTHKSVATQYWVGGLFGLT